MSDDDLRERLDWLESLVEDQQDTIDDLQETIAEQRDRIAELEGNATDVGEVDHESPISRRNALKAGGLVGLLGLGAGTASADPQGQIGTSSDPLTTLYTREVNSDGSLTVDIDSTDDETGETFRITQDGATTSLLTVNDGGEVDIERGPLDLNGNALTTTGSIAGNLTGATTVTDLAGAGLSINGGALRFTNVDLFDFGSPAGVISENFSGLDINSPNDGNVTVPAGSGYVADAASGRITAVDWTETVLGPFTADTEISVGVDNSGNPTTGVGTSPAQIFLGEVITDSNQRIAVLKRMPQVIDHNPSRIDRVLRLAFGNVVDSGLVVTENSSNPAKLDVSAGTYVFGTNIYTPSGGSTVTWGAYYLDANNNPALEDESLSKDTVPARYNDPGDTTPLKAIPSGKYARHAFFVVGDGTTEQYVLLYGQTTYSSVTNARNGDIPPRLAVLSGNVALIASIIVNDSGDIETIIDER